VDEVDRVDKMDGVGRKKVVDRMDRVDKQTNNETIF
jgi:hypothetical protein